jgi:hypothetical protein
MSGGYLKDGLKAGEHQVVIFTFKGEIDAPTCREWNKEILRLKKLDALKNNLISVTLNGEKTPPELMP